MHPSQLPFSRPSKPREHAPRPTNMTEPCPTIARSEPRPALPTSPASPCAWCTKLKIEHIIDNEAVGDLSHVKGEGIASLLRQAGTEASYMSRLKRSHERRCDASGAGKPARLLCSSAHIGTPSTFSTYTCTSQPL